MTLTNIIIIVIILLGITFIGLLIAVMKDLSKTIRENEDD